MDFLLNARVQHNNNRLRQVCVIVFLLRVAMMDESSWQPMSAAQRRRQRRLRSMLGHEQQTVRMALATVLHHSYGRVHTENGALRSQNTATRARAEERETNTAPRRQEPPQPPGTQYFDLDDESVPGTRSDRLVDVKPQERVQRRTVEQLVDAVPCLRALDAPVQLVVEQLVTVLGEMEREENAEMNRHEDRILQGAPISATEKAAWRRWALRGGESSSRRKTVQKTGRLHRSKGVADVHAATSSSSSSLLVSCSQFIDRVRFSRCAQRRVPTVQTAQQTAEILQVRLLDQVVSMPVVAVQTVQPVEIPQLQFLDKDDMPVVALTGVLVGTCRKLWRCRSCRSSSRNACPSLYNDRCCWWIQTVQTCCSWTTLSCPL